MRITRTLVTVAISGVVSLALAAGSAPAAMGVGPVTLQPSYSTLVSDDTTTQVSSSALTDVDTAGDSSAVVDDEDAQDAQAANDIAPVGSIDTYVNGTDTGPDDEDVATSDDTALFAVYRSGYGAIHDADFNDGYPCIPGNMWYCYRTNKGRKNSQAAMTYLGSHTGAGKHYLVPISSMTGGGRLRNREHYVYVIYYKMKDGSKRTWKYGITSLNPFTGRTNRQLSGCNLWIHDTFGITAVQNGSCTGQWIALTSTNNGWGKARWLEAALVLAYVRNNTLHRCPPGQRFSCR